MANFNKVILAGNLTRDPELRYTPNGTAIAKLSLAINRAWTTEAGEKKGEVTFVEVSAFGRTGEVIAQYLKKGRPLLVEGRLRLETWDDKETGKPRQKLSVICESFQFMDSTGSREGREAGEGPGGRPPENKSPSQPARDPAVKPDADAPPNGEGDDVPF